jgi:hypothetical protein
VHRAGGRGPRRARQVHFTSPQMVGRSHARITVTSNNVLTKYINVLFSVFERIRASDCDDSR